ncbi:glycoside hydrolase family 76 protein [Suhomyces tanzawaensis NRRL Y-17324]|uniref:Mannan endo-1,6-alpha-mannosidase n=1 Tax=Suhomyces tanzawaensis NRRL Y-17324 TaxID=984487 RepID=A0A1E4SC85_9ASCO|nr:glycoside hydrolase family 76 protein [Suhomyces tanzawaensis NRRL Y-17324]ODV77127.1 glycoside hydrolase family 76 protein [Suhomyces tanzawaensis NRRL Y-17324]
MKLHPYIILASVVGMVQALHMDTNNLTNIKQNAALVADGLMNYYDGYRRGGTIGKFIPPYYWWEAGGAWGSLIDYSYYMENNTYHDVIQQAMEYQTGDDYNYIPLNESTTEGNDDQGFWGVAVIAAAEKNFTNPKDPKKQWLALAQAVFNTMSARWDPEHCGGGLRWQIFQWNSGYNYKNSVSNGCLFHIGARLARYTGNDSYADWSEKVWDWMIDSDLIIPGPYWKIVDGLEVDNCSDISPYQWTYNHGLFLAGCAYLYNYTEDEKWRNRTLELLKGAVVFFGTEYDIMYEAACQPSNTCNQDQRSFKAYFSRFLGLTMTLVPETEAVIRPWLVNAANAAANSCSGGTDGVTCGLNWFTGGWDGKFGLGEQMCALEAMTNLQANKFPIYTATTGGSSQGNPAGGYAVTNTNASPLKLGAGDTAGAGIITAIIGVSIVASGVWLVL